MCFSLSIVVLKSVHFIHCFLYSGLWKWLKGKKYVKSPCTCILKALKNTSTTALAMTKLFALIYSTQDGESTEICMFSALSALIANIKAKFGQNTKCP